KNKFIELLQKPLGENGYNKSQGEIGHRFPAAIGLRHNDTHTGGGEQRTETAPVAVHNAPSAMNTSVASETEMMNNRPTTDRVEESEPALFHGKIDLGHGDVLIAAITSCTNTSNPSVMIAAGLVAKKASERGMTLRPAVKASLAPGSRVVTDYLEKTGLQYYLDQLGFNLVGYGCTTCIGNSGPLDPGIEEVISKQ